MALASAAASAASGNNNSDQKFEKTREIVELVSGSDTLGDNVFKCPNDMCRHNKVSSAMTTGTGYENFGTGTGKRKICLCGRTMVNQSLLLTSEKTRQITAAATSESGKEVTTSKQHNTTDKISS